MSPPAMPPVTPLWVVLAESILFMQIQTVSCGADIRPSVEESTEKGDKSTSAGQPHVLCLQHAIAGQVLAHE